MSLMDELGAELGKKKLPAVHVGDTVRVHYLIREGDKERVQIFQGTVLAIQGVIATISTERIIFCIPQNFIGLMTTSNLFYIHESIAIGIT